MIIYNILDGSFSDEDLLFFACQKRDKEVLESLLKKGVDPNNSYHCNGIDLALVLASKNGFTEIVELLLNYGADPNMIDKNYHLPITEASKYGFIEIVRLLILNQIIHLKQRLKNT